MVDDKEARRGCDRCLHLVPVVLVCGFGLVQFGKLLMQTSSISKNIARAISLRKLLPELPAVTLDYGRSPFNQSKVALLIENRPVGTLAPLLLHMIGVLPPDWRFRLLGSDESVAMMKKSAAVRRQVKVGKLDLTYLPKNVTLHDQEDISRFLTDLWVYQTLLQPAEWLLVFQTDSMCPTRVLICTDG